jgi:hypothetical protein
MITATTIPMSFEDVEQGDLADVTDRRMATDSNSDSNTGGWWRSTASGCAGSTQVKDAYERA